MGHIFVGWILIILGIFFVVLGLAAAARDVILKYYLDLSSESVPALKNILEIFVALIKALTKAPQWLALTIVGLIIIILGSTWAF